MNKSIKYVGPSLASWQSVLLPRDITPARASYKYSHTRACVKSPVIYNSASIDSSNIVVIGQVAHAKSYTA